MCGFATFVEEHAKVKLTICSTVQKLSVVKRAGGRIREKIGEKIEKRLAAAAQASHGLYLVQFLPDGNELEIFASQTRPRVFVLLIRPPQTRC